jgi:putative tributyrin esterase
MQRTLRSGFLLTLAIFSAQAFSFQTQQIKIPSQKMGKTFNGTVVVPDRYVEKSMRFPTVYVLHGWSGNDGDWTSKTEIAKLSDLHGIILVMPDGDYDKWYIDSPINLASNFETYVGKEVIEVIDKTFRTLAKKEGRAITGLSMGGYGALNVALNFSATFGAAGSLSGGVDPRDFSKNWGLEAVFGDREKNAGYWAGKTIINNAHRFIFSGIDLYIDCGVDDFFIDSNRELHRRLLDLRIAHDYSERPGGHSWEYWNNAIRYQMLFFAEKFKSKLSAGK